MKYWQDWSAHIRISIAAMFALLAAGNKYGALYCFIIIRKAVLKSPPTKNIHTNKYINIGMEMAP
jgi:hypothetical protein